jgi:hypothetical protein
MLRDRPRTQLTAARWLRPGDYLAKADATFAIVSDADHVAEIDCVTVETLDGALWVGSGDTPFPVAADRGVAAEWNRRLSELDLAQWAQTNGFR